MTHTPSPVIVLIGLRGTGKTTLGRELARVSGRRFDDLDHRALAACPESTINEVFQQRGESAWRDAEAAALEGALAQDGLVLALGGGAPMVPSIAARLEQARDAGTCRVVCLDAPPEVLAERISAHDEQRPALLTDASGVPYGPLEESQRLRAQRWPTFERLADAVVDTAADLETVLARLQTALDAPGNRPI